MSDEEGSEYEEEEVEEQEQEAELVADNTSQKSKRVIAADDADGKIQEYEERRRIEREKEEEELRKLKEKQERRKAEREEEERMLAERLKEAEERRRVEEEERKAKFDAEKKKREEEKKKREQMMASLTGQKLVIPEKKAENKANEKFGNIVQAKQEMGMTKEQKEFAKRTFLQTVEKQIGDADGLTDADMKAKIKEMHSRIGKLETDKYDLEKRHERQEYDLKELNERQRQVARNKALRKGVDPADAGSSHHPPKVQIMSKYDRQTDRRNFNERRMMYENSRAYPVFPGVPPPPTKYDKVIKGDFKEEDEDGYNNDNEENEEAEEEEVEE